MGKHFAIVVGVALIATASVPAKAIAASEDYEKQARELLSTVKTLDDLDRVTRAHPKNPILRLVRITIPVQAETGQRVRQLFAQLEDKDLPDLERVAQADVTDLRRIEAAIGRTKANVTAAGQQLDRIYEDQIRKIGEAARELVSEREVQVFLKGFDSKRQREADILRRFLAAHSAVYDAFHDRVLFLISANGRYSYHHALQRVVFPDSADLAKYNGFIERLIAANRELESVQKEVAELTEYRPGKAR
jgi:hypothetical protein